MTVQIFIVFHSKIFDECYKDIPADVLYTNFTFLAVNETIAKSYTPGKYKIVNEWELPIYDKTMQEKGYRENSALYHVYVNKLHTPYTHVGFFQYDMVFSSNLIPYVESTIREESLSYFPLEVVDFTGITANIDSGLSATIITEYELFFNLEFRKDKQYPLCNSYILPIHNYEHVMSWVSQLYDRLYPLCGPSCVAGAYERVMSYAISQETLVTKSIDVHHEWPHFKNLA